jgi:hypothetical protein
MNTSVFVQQIDKYSISSRLAIFANLTLFIPLEINHFYKDIFFRLWVDPYSFSINYQDSRSSEEISTLSFSDVEIYEYISVWKMHKIFFKLLTLMKINHVILSNFTQTSFVKYTDNVLTNPNISNALLKNILRKSTSYASVSLYSGIKRYLL